MEKKLFRFITLALLASAFCSSCGCSKHALKVSYGSGQEITTQTFVYTVTQGDSLKLDIYIDPSAKVDGPRPVILYQHGGGWDSDDTREQGKKWLSSMARYGYAGVSIDYRLGIRELKKQTGKNGPDPEEFGTWYNHAITLGVEAIYDATAFLLAHATELNINPECIIVSGGSAGATDVLVAEYRLVNKEEIATSRLPKDFNYAAVISCAGGIWGPGRTEPQWKGKPCPILFFHGDKDQLVPYDHVISEDCDFSAWGPKVIAPQLKGMGVPYLFLTGIDCDHALSGIPFVNCLELMQSYLYRVLFRGERISLEITENYLDEPMTIPYILTHLGQFKDDM